MKKELKDSLLLSLSLNQLKDEHQLDEKRVEREGIRSLELVSYTS